MGYKDIYLDNAASTKPSESVINQMITCARDIYGNPSSMHDIGYKAKEVIDNAKENISHYLNCLPDELYFTTGATMSNNVAIQGFLRANKNSIFIYSSIEHNDIILLAEWLRTQNIECLEIEVDNQGMIEQDNLIKHLEYAKSKNMTPLVSIQMANNEVGTIQHSSLLSKIIHDYGGVFHTDATQYIAHFPVDVNEIGIDMLSMSGQKINCIKGIGLLYVRSGINISPLIFGEQGLIGGTENVIGIACLSQAFTDISDYSDYFDNIKKQKLFIDNIHSLGLNIVGSQIHRLPNNICVMFKRLDGTTVVQFLNDKHIYASTGSACSSHSNSPSHVIKALHYSDNEAGSCVRFTINNNTTEDDINYVTNIIKIMLDLINHLVY